MQRDKMTEEFSLSFLVELEREKVLEVLRRDQVVQTTEDDRIRKLKMQLQQLRWKGAKNVNNESQERSCARCQKSLGWMLNRGAVCEGCSHRICSGCRICLNTFVWKCTVCYAHREVKIKTGDWFFEERAKKFSLSGKYETTGTKLLKSYQEMSNISVVPPTPPPFSEAASGGNSVNLSQSKGFTKSVENLFLSLTTHMKKISKSQDDVTAPSFHLTEDYGQHSEWRKERRSQSDTAIDIANRITNAPYLLNLIAKKKEEMCGESNFKQEEESNFISNTVFSGGSKSGSIYSVNSACTEAGNYNKADVIGEIELSIMYNFKTSTLEICIKACRNLAYGEEKKKKCNPYVKTYLLPDKSPQSKLKTAVKKNTVNPSFLETLKYKIHCSQLETRILQISVWHLGTLKRKTFLGEVLIPFESWDFEDISLQSFSWYQLKIKEYLPRNADCCGREY
ncbi:synaptotagmin-like protein 3 isoform X1 [Microcaecilia unicolor]|uniref:Synaptotagmin-like protein 3 isoform X1 n=1 Tax=Microcaecilia unicolor TaxID=1415580 RepID=A0A6P7XUD8_9AMPH|nr:synaptotagmin-like protein 3 isoform X1 [Microcaecilia unicolor]